MNITQRRRAGGALATAFLLSFSGLVAAEPPSRAARLGYLSGSVSFSPAGQPDWVRANVNRPLTTGDRLWTGNSSGAELQVGGAAIRLGPSTSVVLLNLDNRIAQLQLSEGTLKIRVRSLGRGQTFEIATPNLAFTLRRAGEYRIEVDPQDDATAVIVSNGEGEVYGVGASYTVNSRRAYRFYGNRLSDYEALSARREDALDRWSRERDQRGNNSVSARYVSSEVVGYEDLDANGSWRVDANYGSVWTPTRVAAGWTPYRDGHWSWVQPWGWTWVDDAPWGYAVSHYGRWARISNNWSWVPGPRREQAVYAPALVAFIGGKNFQGSASAGGASTAHVGWFPLAPRDVYQPSYASSRAYFDSINRSNAVIPATTISQVYNTTIVNNTSNVTQVTQVTNVIYANQQVTGAVVAVPALAFLQSQPVAKATVQLTREAVASAPVLRVASVAPVQQSVQGGAHEAATTPPLRNHPVIARTAPPPAALPFAAQQAQLAARPGRPIDEAQRTQIKPAAPAVDAPRVSVVAAAPAPTATALPPATAPGAKSPEARKAEMTMGTGRRGEDRRPVTDKPAPASVDAVGADAAKAEAAKAAALKAEASKTEAARTAAAQAEAAKAGAAQEAAAKAEAAKAEAAKAATVKADLAKADAAKAAAIKADAAKAEASKAGEASAERARAEAAKAEAQKAEAARAEAAKATTAKAESAKAEAMKAEATRADAAKAAAAKAETAKAEAAKADAARADAAKIAAAKADSTKAEAAKADVARADAARIATVRAEAAKAEAARAEAARAAAAKNPPAAAASAPPERRASGPKADAEPNPDEAKTRSRKP